jgi:hypothetical protein
MAKSSSGPFLPAGSVRRPAHKPFLPEDDKVVLKNMKLFLSIFGL